MRKRLQRIEEVLLVFYLTVMNPPHIGEQHSSPEGERCPEKEYPGRHENTCLSHGITCTTKIVSHIALHAHVSI